MATTKKIKDSSATFVSLSVFLTNPSIAARATRLILLLSKVSSIASTPEGVIYPRGCSILGPPILFTLETGISLIPLVYLRSSLPLVFLIGRRNKRRSVQTGARSSK